MFSGVCSCRKHHRGTAGYWTDGGNTQAKEKETEGNEKYFAFIFYVCQRFGMMGNAVKRVDAEYLCCKIHKSLC